MVEHLLAKEKVVGSRANYLGSTDVAISDVGNLGIAKNDYSQWDKYELIAHIEKLENARNTVWRGTRNAPAKN